MRLLYPFREEDLDARAREAAVRRLRMADEEFASRYTSAHNLEPVPEQGEIEDETCRRLAASLKMSDLCSGTDRVAVDDIDQWLEVAQ